MASDIQSQGMSSVDVAWYQMEDPTNLMMITGLLHFDRPVDFERLRATLQYRFVERYRRFRQRVVDRNSFLYGGMRWEDDPTFDMSAHLHRIALPPPGDRQALQELVSDLMSMPLDFSKPLWQMHLVEDCDGGCALLVRLHHCIADGIALVQVMLSLTDASPDAPVPTAETNKRQPRGWNPLRPVLRPVASTLKLTQKVAATTARTYVSILRDPEQLVDLGRVASDVALTTGRLLLMAPDPKTPYKGKLGVPKRAAWSTPIPLDEVKLISRAVGGTVNDVLMSAAAGAMRRYLISQGSPVDDLNFRAVIPVNLRPLDQGTELGNKFGLFFLSMPIGLEDPVDRLRELKRRMDGLKNTTEPIVAFGILNLIGRMPNWMEDIVVDIFGTKGTVVLTNVPGPRQKLYFAGAGIEDMMFWVPQSGRLGIGISIFSYDNKVMLGVATDEGLIPEPEAVINGFHEELEALRAEMRQRLMDTAIQFNILPPAP
jgi:WS/DGAT/MGAT family acyltransferase